MSDLKKYFDEWLQPQWMVSTPGVWFEVYKNGQKLAEYKGGQVYPFYDLASLTKVLFTVPAMMLLFARNKWNPDTTVSEVLPWWPHKETKIIDLLTHSAGLHWWKPLYKDWIQRDSLFARWQGLREEILASPLSDENKNEEKKSVYSDIGFMSLAFILEALYEEPLSEIWKKVKSEFAPASELHWNPTALRLMAPPRVESMGQAFLDYAPTEECPWRGRRLQGEVHDENAWALGGLSTHAGLFGRPQDAAQVFLRFRRAWLNESDPLHSTVSWFIQRKRPPEWGDWAAGLMMPTLGQASCGQYLSPSSVGHTGFTGTSIWWDHEKDWLIVIVSNRVFLGRDRREFAKLRPLLHDEIVLQLLKTSF